MKKLLFLTLAITAIAPTATHAQKHAPRPYTRTRAQGIYPEGSTRLLRPADVAGLNSWDLKVMRNEIFARHGYIFKTADMADYFSRQSWYTPRYDDVMSMLSPVEKKNIEFIKAYEG